MSKPSMMSRLSIRASLILVCVFFLLMLLAGAALGVLSLRDNNQSLERILRTQQLEASLSGVMSGYTKEQLLLGSALAARMTGAGADADRQIEAARRMLETGHARLASYRQGLAISASASQRLAQALTSYEQLLSESITPLIDHLAANDLQAFRQRLEGPVATQSAGLSAALATLRGELQQEIQDIYDAEVKHYGLVVILVGLGMLASIGVALLTYVFLGRMVLQPLRQAGVYFDRIAGGDLTQRVTVESHNEIGSLYESLRRMQESLTRTVTLVRQGVEEITLGAREIYVGNTDLSSRTEQQAAALQETAAGMDEFASTVRQNTDNALQADTLAKSASDVAHRGGAAVSAVVNMMQEISTSSGKITEIVGVIDGIAFQTNILALNAAVEAARAGEQGKGFAVVAGEVRSLAQRSAQAAREIKQLIEASQLKIDAGARQAVDAGNVMGEVVSSVGGVTTIMGEISLASREQSQGIDEVNRAMADMDGAVQQNAALVQEAAAAAGSLQEQADRLAEAVAVFKVNAAEIIDMPKAELPGTAGGMEILRRA